MTDAPDPIQVAERLGKLAKIYAGQSLTSQLHSEMHAYSSRSQLMQDAAQLLRSLSARDEWLPIESAPKDGTRILVWIPQAAWEPTLRPCMAAAHWNTRWEGWEDTAMADLTDHAGFDDWQPTHWRPLPDPPALTDNHSESAGAKT